MIQLLLLILLPGALGRPADEPASAAPSAHEARNRDSSNETDDNPLSNMGSRNVSSRYSFYNHGVDNDTLSKMNPEEIAAFTEVFKLWANDTLNAQQKMEFLEKELNISDEATAEAVMNTLNITLCFADYIHEQKRKLDPKLQEVVNTILSKMTDFNFITQDSEVIDAFINDTTKGLSDQLMKQLEDFDELAESEMKKLGIELDWDENDNDNSTETDHPNEDKKDMAMDVKKDAEEAAKEDSNSTATEPLLRTEDGKNSTEVDSKGHKESKSEDKNDKDGGEKDEKDSVESHKDNNSEEKDKKVEVKLKRAVIEHERNSTSTPWPEYPDDDESKEGPEPTGTEEKKKKRQVDHDKHHEHHGKTTPKP